MIARVKLSEPRFLKTGCWLIGIRAEDKESPNDGRNSSKCKLSKAQLLSIKEEVMEILYMFSLLRILLNSTVACRSFK